MSHTGNNKLRAFDLKCNETMVQYYDHITMLPGPYSLLVKLTLKCLSEYCMHAHQTLIEYLVA